MKTAQVHNVHLPSRQRFNLQRLFPYSRKYRRFPDRQPVRWLTPFSSWSASLVTLQEGLHLFHQALVVLTIPCPELEVSCRKSCTV